MVVAFYVSLIAFIVSVFTILLSLLLRKRSSLIQETVTTTPWHKDPNTQFWHQKPLKGGAFKLFQFQKNYMTYSTRVELNESMDTVEAVEGLKKGDPAVIYFAMRFFGIAGLTVFFTLTIGFAIICFGHNQKGWVVVGLAVFFAIMTVKVLTDTYRISKQKR